MQENENPSVEPMRRFWDASQEVRFQAEGRTDIYAWVEQAINQRRPPPAPYNKSQMLRRVIIVGGVVATAVAGALSYLTVQVRLTAGLDEKQPADVILVLGAAEYRGRPSPVLKSRLNHALDLYRQGLAPRILTTGGSGGDPDFTEGEVGRNYLVRKGVPSEAILVEPEAETTFQSVLAAGEIMRRMNLRSCLLVSDGYHLLRSKRMLEERGLIVYGSPSRGSQPAPAREWWLSFRQAVGLMLWSAHLRW